MGINKQSDLEANLQIGPTDRGMGRIYVVGDGIEMPMDLTPAMQKKSLRKLWWRQRPRAGFLVHQTDISILRRWIAKNGQAARRAARKPMNDRFSTRRT